MEPEIKHILNLKKKKKKEKKKVLFICLSFPRWGN